MHRKHDGETWFLPWKRNGPRLSSTRPTDTLSGSMSFSSSFFFPFLGNKKKRGEKIIQYQQAYTEQMMESFSLVFCVCDALWCNVYVCDGWVVEDSGGILLHGHNNKGVTWWRRRDFMKIWSTVETGGRSDLLVEAVLKFRLDQPGMEGSFCLYTKRLLFFLGRIPSATYPAG